MGKIFENKVAAKIEKDIQSVSANITGV